jgi:AcrR family transcriptional regulator
VAGARSGEAIFADEDRRSSGEGEQVLYRKLKPGPRLPREQVKADQRERLHGAMIALVDREGWRNVRVRTLSRAAGVSSGNLYRHFANTDECLASTYDALMGSAIRGATAAQARQPGWELSLRATVTAVMQHFGTDPRAARLALLEIFGGGTDSRKRIAPSVAAFEQTLAASFATAPGAIKPPRHLIAGMTAGMLRVARSTTLTGRGEELPGLAEELCDWMLTLPSPKVLALLGGRSGSSAARWRPEPHPFPADEAAPARPGTGDRDRILRAAIKLTMEDGIANLTAARLRAEAGVSRSRFDACFEGLEDCFLQAIELIAVDAATRAQSWSEQAKDWERQTCRFILALCAQMARNRPRARLAFLGILAPGPNGLTARESLLERTATILRHTVPPAKRPSPIATEASVAATWHIAQADIAAARTRSLPLVAPLLSYVTLVPIVGSEQASLAIDAEIRLPASGAGTRRRPR